MKIFPKLTTFGLTSLLAMNLSAYAADDTAKLSAAQVEQVKQVIHDYLVANPQVLVEASEALQQQRENTALQNAPAAISAKATQIFADPNSPVAGNPKGDVTLVEFFDYQCPHCKDMETIVEQLQKADPKLRIVYKELPIFGGASKDASIAALAAKQQGDAVYLKFHNALLANAGALDKDKILQIAQAAGVNMQQLNQAMNNEALKQQIDANFALAQSLQLMGTPTFIIAKWNVDGKDNVVKNPVFLPGVVTLDNLKAAVDKARSS
ncbi:MAG: DsbA family protein [Gammaproteobacteria bacterium]